MMKLKKIIRTYKKAIKDCAAKSTVQDKVLDWIRDNSRQLLSALENGEKQLKKQKYADSGKVFRLCLDICRDGELPDEDGIILTLKNEGLLSRECELLPCFIAASLACTAAAAIPEAETETGEKIIKQSVKALLMLKNTDFEKITAGISRTEQYLLSDPAGIYPDMSEQTKRIYRKAAAEGAEKEGISEERFTLSALKKAEAEKENHIGFYLPVKRQNPEKGKIFLAAEVFVSLIISILFSIITDMPLIFFLLFFPVFTALKPFSDLISRKIFPVIPLCSMDENRDISAENETLIVVSALMPPASKAEMLYSHLEKLKNSDKSGKVRLMLLLDRKSAKVPELPEDEADTAAVKRLTDRLNNDNGGGFAIAVRERRYSATEAEYTGFERKRGAIAALIRYITEGDADGFSLIYGDKDNMNGIKYIAALDSDTELSFEVLKKLCAVASHPLNKAVIDRENCRIVSGYGCIVPRIETTVASSGRTFFSKLYTNGGSVAYSNAVSERYMDMFGTTLFTGKGLIDVNAFNTVVGSRFETGRILSHDILEGALLRTAFVGNCEFSDSFPSKPSSFFSRAERWIRGDIQNLKYIFAPIAEYPVRTVLDGLTRYQLADNIRRAVSPCFALISIITALFLPPFPSAVLLTAALLSECSDSLLSCMSLIIKGGISSAARLYFSDEITSGLKSFIKIFLDTGLIPVKAAVNSTAMAKGFYRCVFSRKNLLQWTTAQQADGTKNKNIIPFIIVPVLTGVLCIVFGSALFRLFAVLALIAAVFTQTDGIVLHGSVFTKPDRREREILYSFEAAMWNFFSENVNGNENHLPPDNIQETPVHRTARRTSPTNIGLYLTSAAAACDLGIISHGDLYDRIKNTFSTLDELEKYRGCLFNWYDTRTKKPLQPTYISAVDCGNFLCCLTALKEAMKEYANKDNRFSALVTQAEKMLDEADLRFLYDKRRKLFRIGSDAEGNLSESYYDLLMSEFRMTSYYETARRHIPPEHWGSLGRTLLRSGRYSAAASWTGTMFEYFMPALFLPVIPGSFQYESLKVALSAQKNRVKKTGIPYGISESCFYSVDAASNYRYKAHGISHLAMKRLADDEPVISPYSTFLTLPFDFKSAMKNLSRLSALHAEGRYGFYEALDFTKKRTDGEDYCPVRCYMSHHIGMSMIAAANTLLDNIFVKRFMRDKDMASAENLLCEKIPDEADIFRKKINRNNLNRPEHQDIRRSGGDAAFGEASAYGSGEWTFFTDIYGRNHSSFSSLEMYRYSKRSRGISLCAKCGEDIFPLNTVKETQTELTKTAAVMRAERENCRITSAFLVHPSVPALMIPVKVKNTGEKTGKISVTVYFEPSLLQVNTEDSHPAFSDMFINTSYDENRHYLCFERLRSASGTPALCTGLYSSAGFNYETERERILSRDTDREYPCYFASSSPHSPDRAISTAAAVTLDFELAADKSTEKVLIITCAENKKAAVMRLEKIRSLALPDISKGAGMLLGRDTFTANAADTVIKDIFFGCELSQQRLYALNRLDSGRDALWQAGISGDYPIITVNTAEECSESVLRSFIRLHTKLKKTGINNDTVFLFRQTDDYSKTGEQTLRRLMKEEDTEDEEGIKGGISLLNTNALSERTLNTLLAFSSFIFPDSEYRKLLPPEHDIAAKGELPCDAKHGFCDGGFYISEHPDIPWCHTLSNKSFGTLLSDRSAGFSWALNSRQNKLTPWSNDTASDLDGEKLFLYDGEKVFDCFANCEVFFADTFARYVTVCGNIRVTVTVSVPEKGMKKTVAVKLDNEGESTADIRLIYRLRPVMNESEKYAFCIRCKKTEDGIILTNPVNGDIRGFMLLYGENDAAYDLNTKSLNKYAQAGYSLLIAPGMTAKKQFGICFAKQPSALQVLKNTVSPPREPMHIKVRDINAPGAVFASSLLLHQVYDTRLTARTGFYQCSGAYGFRDQLQDILALLKYRPGFCREIILKMAAVQFPEGDVLHWYHPLHTEKGNVYAGVRTKCSDDMLWLPFVTAKYVSVTGDRKILDKTIPYLEGSLLKEDEHDRYDRYVHSAKKGSLYEHCLKCFLPSSEVGAHSLPLIKGGDWNDSFGEVGCRGKGESVWLAMFMKAAAEEFAGICKLKNDNSNKDRLLKKAKELTTAIERFAWDGKKYLRAFYDDGSAMGTDSCRECDTDLLPQSWAVLCGMPDRERRISALKTAYERLYDEEHGIIKLFAPPFTKDGKRAGYVNDYPEGMRENGGQYTHAAVWFLTALRKEGLDDMADKVLAAILPDGKYMSDFGNNIYKTEPYALCGDVYSAKGLEGRGGWSLYTGSAGWLAQYFRDF